MSSKLIAYHGGSGMWQVRSADGSRAYVVTTGRDGNVASIQTRTRGMLRRDGATGKEIARAIKAARAKERAASEALKR